MTFDDRIHSLTTPLLVEHAGGAIAGSGFFFGVLGAGDETEKPQWLTVERIWVISNKHILWPAGPDTPQPPKSVTIHTREVKDGRVEWLPITYYSDRVQTLIRLHPDREVDVAALDVTAELIDMLKEARPLAFSIMSKSEFPGSNKLAVGVGSDVLVIGYPRGFYDAVNKFPVVKTGVIASRWGAPFAGKRHCLIDAKLFPGSSGSLVITHPTQVTVHEGQLLFSQDPQFCVVGVYSGELYLKQPPVETEEAIIVKKESFNLGIVWYPETIFETVTQVGPPDTRHE